ncbi:MAG: DNA-directed RNA polymerase subunit alpha [Ardenticatenia bacterium]|nr:DNA-directed RNA polymerase subunit alpha [Ardenticatenia bacterium]
MDIVFPRIEREVMTKTHGRFVISPLMRGYGITVGNALRRVLLSSLPGAAVTSIRVTGVHHEFSPIPGAREDMIQLILNIKQLRLRCHTDDPVRMRIEARGPGLVTAADIQAPAQVEIVNPELHLLTLDSDEAEFEMEMTVQRGRGYSPADQRGRLPVDEIPVDAIFSPIRHVRYNVKQERVGQSHDFDRLILNVWTDGTMGPDEALVEAAKILMSHFAIVAGVEEGIAVEPTIATPTPPKKREEGIPHSIYNRPIEDLGLQVRAFNCLKRAGITKVGEVLERLQRGREEMLAIRNFGEKSLDELLNALEEKGYLQYVEIEVDAGTTKARRGKKEKTKEETSA